MSHLKKEYNSNKTQHTAVFRRRIDEKNQVKPETKTRYAASALNYPDRHTGLSNTYDQQESMFHQAAKKNDAVRWQQNYSTQDIYLGHCVSEGLIVDILMKNDSTRRGRIESYDNWSLLVAYEGKRSLLFKSGVMAITAANGDESYNKDYFGAQHLSDFSSEYSHNPA